MLTLYADGLQEAVIEIWAAPSLVYTLLLACTPTQAVMSTLVISTLKGEVQ